MTEREAGNLLVNLCNKICQDTISAVLSHHWHADWAQKLYDMAASHQHEPRTTANGAMKDFYHKVRQHGGRATASASDIDATLGYQLTVKYPATKNHFAWESGLGDCFNTIRVTRNGVRHTSDPDAADIEEYFKECFAAAYTLPPCLTGLTAHMPPYMNGSQLYKVWSDRFDAAVSRLYSEAGSRVRVDNLKEEARAKAAYGHDLSASTEYWFNAAVLPHYPNTLFKESLQVFQTACRINDSFAALPYYLEHDRRDDVTSLSPIFSDKAIRRAILSLNEAAGYDLPDKAPLTDVIKALASATGHTADDEPFASMSRVTGRRSAGAYSNLQERLADSAVLYLSGAYLFRASISKAERDARLESAIDRHRYARRVIAGFESYQDQEALDYVPLKWRTPGDAGQAGQLRPIEEILKETDARHFKLFGEAGTGKTTTLRYMQYRNAQDLNAGLKTDLPVYIELQRLGASEGSLLTNAVASELGTDIETAQLMLDAGLITLYLDGYNEILDQSKKVLFARQLNAFLRDHPDQLVFMSDRTPKLVYPVMKDALPVYFEPFHAGDTRAFIEATCRSKEAREKLLKLCDDNDPRLADFDSPLKIRHLIAAFTRTGEIPEDLVHEYIQFLLEREAEKMDPNVIYVETYLQVLGYIVETRPDGAEIEDGLRSADAERIFGRLKDYRGWAAQDSRGILMLTLDMGLLITAETDSGARLMFASDSYSYYFYLDAVDTGSDADAQAIMADLWGYHDRSGTTDS